MSAALVCIVALALCGGLTWYYWRRHRADLALWTVFTVPGAPPMAYQSKAADFDLAKLERAVNLAVDSITKNTRWARSSVLAALNNVHIYILPVEKWDYAGGRVAGQTFFVGFTTVAVGPSFAALCHEFGHVVEDALTYKTDYTHESWRDNGMNAAQAEYAAALYG